MLKKCVFRILPKSVCYTYHQSTSYTIHIKIKIIGYQTFPGGSVYWWKWVTPHKYVVTMSKKKKKKIIRNQQYNNYYIVGDYWT